MGKDEDAAADPALRARGIAGLRVCDSSVMPAIITGPTPAPSMLIGATAADMIVADGAGFSVGGHARVRV